MIKIRRKLFEADEQTATQQVTQTPNNVTNAQPTQPTQPVNNSTQQTTASTNTSQTPNNGEQQNQTNTTNTTDTTASTTNQQNQSIDYNAILKGFVTLQTNIINGIKNVYSEKNIAANLPAINAAEKNPNSPIANECKGIKTAINALANVVVDPNSDDVSTKLDEFSQKYEDLKKSINALTVKITELNKETAAKQEAATNNTTAFMTTESLKHANFTNTLNKKLKYSHFNKILEMGL